jgi:hypothetical protein
MMSEPLVRIRLDDVSHVYYPGETLSGEYWLQSMAPDEVRAVEVSLLWHTEGKGDEDMAVHHFHRSSAENDGAIRVREPSRFSTVLPKSPLSYRGMIVKVRWCVRVRVFLTHGREVVGQLPFRLGEVRRAKVSVP